MKHLWNSLLFIFLLASCTTEKNSPIITDFIPENASTIFKINHSEDVKSNFVNNSFLSEFSSTKTYKKIQNRLVILDSLNLEDETLLCFNKDSSDSLQYLIISNISRDSVTIDSSKIEAFKHYRFINDFLIIASNEATLKTSINTSKQASKKQKLLNTSNKSLSIYTNKNNALITSFFINDSLSNNYLSNKVELDINMSQDALLFNGVSKAIDSSKSIVSVFKNTIPQENNIDKITPSNSDGFMSFTFDDATVFKSNLKLLTKNDSIQDNSLFDFISEVGVIYQNKERAIILRSIDETATQETLSEEQNIVDTYRQIPIMRFSNKVLFSETFSPFINYDQATKYCVLDTFFVFSNSTEILQNIITNYQNKTTLSERSYFSNLKENLTDEASLLMVVNTEKLVDNYEAQTGNDFSFTSKKYNKAALQLIYEDGFAHTNIAIEKAKKKAVENSITEQFNIKLDHDLLNNPQFVTNHINKQKEIVVQDVNNQLYLISNTGKILWKKQLQGAVLGNISQIDMYKNGRLQLAFTTPNRLYVLDRNGKEVSPFPLQFRDAITQPLSIFDYDKKRNYRLLVTQNNSVLMYDAKGKTVNGFTFNNAGSTILHQPQHFRIGSKDYLVIKTKNKLHILDRTGKTRVTPKQSYNYSIEAMYVYNNKFTTSSKNGSLIYIDQKGNIASENLDLDDKHHIATTSKTLVTLTENKLTIRDKTLELDFGDYKTPKIFFINNKLYITVTDLQSQKIFLFDSQAKLQSNFPIYGNSPIDLANADHDNALEFVTKGDSNTIILYQIN